MMKTSSEYHFQSSQMSITELLISSVKQDAHEKIVTETFSEYHFQSFQMSIIKILLTQTQFSQFKSFEYMLLKNDKNMNESSNEILSDASDSDFVLMTVAANIKSSLIISVT